MSHSSIEQLKRSIEDLELASVRGLFERALLSERGVAAVVVGFLLLLNVLPMLAVIAASFTADGYLMVTSPSLNNWVEVFSQRSDVIVNTLYFTAGSATLTTVLAIGISWVIARTDAPLKDVYYYAVLLPFFLPPVVYEDAWVRLLSNNGVYPTLLGFDSFPVHSIPGMIFVQSIRLVPLGILLLIPLLRNTNVVLEEASRVSGAGLLTTLRRITLPILAPGILAVFLFTFIITLGSFRVPLILGLPERILVIATEIFLQTNNAPADFGVAFAEGTVLIVLAIPMLYLYKKYLGKSEQYASVSGQGYSRTQTELGPLKYVASGIVGLFVVFAVFGPILIMVYTSLLPYYQAPHNLGLSGFLSTASISPYVEALQNEMVVEAAFNSFLVAFVGSTLVCIFVVLISWLIQKTSIPYREALDYLAFVPIGVPSVALGLGVAFTYLEILPIGIYGTLIIFVVAFFTRSVPVNLRIVDPAVIQIDDSMLDAGRISGANLFQTIRTILAPLVLSSVRIAWITSVAYMAMEMAIVMILRSPGTEMISSVLYQLSSEGGTVNQAYAFGVVVLLTLFVTTLVVHKATEQRY